jgi:hypothetical protein
MSDIKNMQKVVEILDQLSNTVGNLVKSVDLLNQRTVDVEETERRLWRAEQEIADLRRSVDRLEA